MTPKEPRKAPRLPELETYTLETLEQIKVLADPLRIRILESFGEERTTKQVADLLGEKPTKLYHHVDALERIGLITLSRTRQNRGTLEKYYLAVARTFRADSRAFQAKERGKKSAAILQVTSTIFDTTSAELASLVDHGEDTKKAIEEEGIVSFLEIRATKAQLKGIRGQLNDLVQSLTAASESNEAGQARYRFTLAFFPLEHAKPGPKRKS